ncbi:MAG: hypothetical protein ACM3KR_06150 [Deltaproteobacteria bacterium]
MLRKLKGSNGGGSIFPIILTIIVSTIFMFSIFVINLDTHLRELQKNRYIKAVDMAVNTAMANVELTDEIQTVNAASQQGQMGLLYEASSFDYLAAGYESHKRIRINKEALMDTFYNVLLRNFQIKGLDNVGNFQRYVPLKAVLEYDTISVSSGIHFDSTKNKYVDDWQDIRLCFKCEGVTTGVITDVYMTIGDRCYIIKPSAAAATDMQEKFKEKNRIYFIPPNKQEDDPANPGHKKMLEGDDPDNPGSKIPLDLVMDTQKKNREMSRFVQNVLRSYANIQKTNKNLEYQMSIAEFDYTIDKNAKQIADRVNGSINAAKDVTFYCLVEGLPMKSLLNDQINRSFSTFSYGGAAIKRADE